METHNGKQGYDLALSHAGEWKLYRFDLTINGSKLYVGTSAVVYPTSAAAIIAGNEWVEKCEGLTKDEIKKLICNPSLIA